MKILDYLPTLSSNINKYQNNKAIESISGTLKQQFFRICLIKCLIFWVFLLKECRYTGGRFHHCHTGPGRAMVQAHAGGGEDTLAAE